VSPRHRRIIACALVFLSSACTTAHASRHAGTLRSSDTLTSEELVAARGTQDAYSAVERLRPLFLVVRPGPIRGTPARLHVIINDGPAADIDVLKSIPLASVESIRRVQATVAFTRYGEIPAGDGVILVRLRR
jgi:hypothetical protein